MFPEATERNISNVRLAVVRCFTGSRTNLILAQWLFGLREPAPALAFAIPHSQGVRVMTALATSCWKGAQIMIWAMKRACIQLLMLPSAKLSPILCRAIVLDPPGWSEAARVPHFITRSIRSGQLSSGLISGDGLAAGFLKSGL